MPKNSYEKGMLGKLLVQDWQIVTGYPDVPRLYILTEQQASALVALSTFLSWRTRWNNLAVDADIDAFASETMFNLMNPITCEMLTECLQPLFDALEAKIDAIQSSVTNITNIAESIQQTQENNAAALPQPVTFSLADEICGGATGVVETMDFTNMKTYNDAESGLVDNFFEALQQILASIPLISELPADDLLALANWFFENQVVDYQADFAEIKQDMICDLSCFIQANDDTFDIDVWADWLDSLEAKYPGNRAAGLFARYSPARLTLLNQIVALINENQSIQSYFDDLFDAYEAGTLYPVKCAGCECPPECEFTVIANIDPSVSPFGQDAGIAVTNGLVYLITADGLWNYGAGGDVTALGAPGTSDPTTPMPAENLGRLIVKVGAGGTWYAGDESFNYTAVGTGNLFFAMNDAAGAYTDNTGELCINVEPV